MNFISQRPALFYSFVLIALIAVLWLSGADAWLAKKVVSQDAPWAWWMRQWSIYPALYVSLAAIIFLMLPWVHKRFPTLRQMAAIWLVALIIGGGLMNQVIVKEVIDRPRPRQTVLLEEVPTQQYSAQIDGNSFPSGHAVIGFIFAVPFFVLNRRKPLAWIFLGVGLSAGFGVGFARMTLGAHYLSDIIGSLLFTLVPAGLLTRWIKHDTDVPTYVTGGFMLVAVSALIGFNDFRTNLFWQPDTAITRLRLDLPCETIEVGRADDLAVRVELEAYGAPVSNMQLQFANDTLSLTQWKGIFHSINCAAQVALPRNVGVALPEGRNLLSPTVPPEVVGQRDGWLTVRY